jgi:phosphoribosylglycinamide formyltransferase-1
MNAAPTRLAVLVSGGGSNMEAIAQACRAGGVLAGIAELVLVLSSRAGVGALERASRLGVPVSVVPSASFSSREAHEAAVLETLAAARTEVVALAGYMRILSASFLSALGAPVVNIHPVPTYLYQGAHGYEHIWAERARLACCFPTVHRVDAGVDTGEVILYGLPYALGDLESLDALRARGLAEEHTVYPLALRQFLRSGDVPGDSPHARFATLVRSWLTARRAGLDAELHYNGLALPCP